ncbi:hypothetical protein OBBRIDRAFT_808770, partial [Obba rivulosa]
MGSRTAGAHASAKHALFAAQEPPPKRGRSHRIPRQTERIAEHNQDVAKSRARRERAEARQRLQQADEQPPQAADTMRAPYPPPVLANLPATPAPTTTLRSSSPEVPPTITPGSSSPEVPILSISAARQTDPIPAFSPYQNHDIPIDPALIDPVLRFEPPPHRPYEALAHTQLSSPAPPSTVVEEPMFQSNAQPLRLLANGTVRSEPQDLPYKKSTNKNRVSAWAPTTNIRRERSYTPMNPFEDTPGNRMTESTSTDTESAGSGDESANSAPRKRGRADRSARSLSATRQEIIHVAYKHFRLLPADDKKDDLIIEAWQVACEELGWDLEDTSLRPTEQERRLIGDRECQ